MPMYELTVRFEAENDKIAMDYGTEIEQMTFQDEKPLAEQALPSYWRQYKRRYRIERLTRILVTHIPGTAQ